MLKRVFLILGLIGSAIANAEPVPPAAVAIVSGGFNSCGTGIHQAMLERLRVRTRALEQSGYPIKYIVTCFTGAFPSERMVFHSIQNGVASPQQVIAGGKNFEARFNQIFLNRYLPSQIPKGARVITVGQSHGGWVSLAVAATRPVDFMATLDPISRTDCSVGSILSVGGLRRLKDGSCNQPQSESLLANVQASLIANGTAALNVFQKRSLPQSGPLPLRGVTNVNLGDTNLAFAPIRRKPPLNPAAHVALATDLGVWNQLLGQLDRKMGSVDPRWTANSNVRRTAARGAAAALITEEIHL